MKIITIAVAFSLVSMASSVNAQQIGLPIMVDYASELKSTSEFKEKAAAVVRGRVEDQRYDNSEMVMKGPLTEYKVRVIEIVKGDNRVRVGDLISVYRHGGLKDGLSIPEAGFAPFAKGDDLLLFLNHRSNQIYTAVAGPEGSYKVKADGRLEPFGHRAVAKANKDRHIGEVTSELKKPKK